MSVFSFERLQYDGRQNFFEGWYFRHTGAHPFSVIVGLTSNPENPHSFVQYIDLDGSHYFSYPLQEFRFSAHNNTVTLGGNIFSLSGIRARLADDKVSIKLDISYAHLNLFKKSLLAPSVMGVFSYLPMPCNHAVVSLSHTVKGIVSVNGKPFDASGEGYIEKDFGNSFPKNYVWLHAINGQTSLMAAVAWPLPLGIRGHLCLVHHMGRQYNLSLGTGARLVSFSAKPDKTHIVISKGNTVIDLKACGAQNGSPLLAPAPNGKMTTTIKENPSAALQAKIYLNSAPLPTPPTCALEIVL